MGLTVQKLNRKEEKCTLFSAKVIALEIVGNWFGKPNKIKGAQSRLPALMGSYRCMSMAKFTFLARWAKLASYRQLGF